MTAPEVLHPRELPAAVDLELGQVSKTFAGNTVLRHVGLTLHAGRIHALLGENGSGKSTLIKILAGVHLPDPGAVMGAGGALVPLTTFLRQHQHRFRFVHQDLGLVPTLSTVENLSLGTPVRTRLCGWIDGRDERDRARRLIAEFGQAFDVTVPIGDLSPAERSIVAIVRALRSAAGHDGDRIELLVLDEPTASLSAAEAARLYAAIRTVADRGSAVVLVSHNLREVLDLCDDVTVLRDGSTVYSGLVAGMTERTLAEAIIGHLPGKLAAGSPARPELRLEVTRLAGSRLRALSFDARRGEVVGFAGVLGSGREQVNGLLFGAVPSPGRAVVLDGAAWGFTTPAGSVDLGVVYIPADRLSSAVIPTASVRENVMLGIPKPTRIGCWLDEGAERVMVHGVMQRLSVKASGTEQSVGTLSGGNQQKVVVGRALHREPRLLLLDEPTQGVDIGARAAIHGLLRDAADRGVTILVSSSDVTELAELCDRVLVMHEGEVVASLVGPDVTEHRLLEAATAAPGA